MYPFIHVYITHSFTAVGKECSVRFHIGLFATVPPVHHLCNCALGLLKEPLWPAPPASNTAADP